MNRYPFGYSGTPAGMGTMLTWDEMMQKKTVRLLHPEFLRRFKAFIEFAASCGVPLGVGEAWRVQPNPPPPGFAKPGNSWHESCPCSPESATALAIDTVPDTSWNWMENNIGLYGMKTFRNVNNEPWHIQMKEVPNSRNSATSLPWIDTNYPLPGSPDPIPSPISGVFTVQGYRQEVVQGSSGRMAKMCQQQINLLSGQGLDEDGDFGPQSVAALKNLQTVLDCQADGECGPKTWQAMEDGIKVQAEAGDWD